MVILTGDQMRAAEKLAVEAGTSFEQLMENAGNGAAQAMILRFGELLVPGANILILLGRGNNGGDGLVIARVLLQWQPELTIDLAFCLEGQLSPLAALNLSRLEEYPQIRAWNQPDQQTFSMLCQRSCLILDGIFGTGFHGQLPGPAALAVQTANSSSAKRIALDIPTGINGDNGLAADNSFQADITYAFAAKNQRIFSNPPVFSAERLKSLKSALTSRCWAGQAVLYWPISKLSVRCFHPADRIPTRAATDGCWSPADVVQ